MVTTVYFVRHAESDYSVHNDEKRPLTMKGKADSQRVTDFLEDKKIHVIISSPFIRAIDTVKSFADKNGMDIIINCDFRERKVDNCWIEDFKQFSEKQWSDFNYKLSDGECLRDVQDRNVRALKDILDQYEDMNIVIGSHGTALSTIINYYDSSYGYIDFDTIRNLMPWIVSFTFEGRQCVEIKKIDVFSLGYHY